MGAFSLLVSIIIPTFNRSDMLEFTLPRIVELTHTYKQLEIILVDNNSSDNTKAVADRYVEKIHYEFVAKQGKNNALNRAIDIARGEILVFIDDDVTPAPKWLDEIIRSCEEWPEHHIFGGKVLPKFPADTPDWVMSGDFAPFVFAIHDLPQNEGPYQDDATPSGPNCWIRKRLFDNNVRYDGNIGPKGTGRVSGSELEFFTRMKTQGIEPVYIPAAEVQHNIQKFQTTIKYLLKRSYASGMGYAYIYGFSGVSKIFGIPRYLFLQIIVNTLNGIWQFLTCNKKKSMETFMVAAHRYGCIKGSLNPSPVKK